MEETHETHEVEFTDGILEQPAGHSQQLHVKHAEINRHKRNSDGLMGTYITWHLH